MVGGRWIFLAIWELFDRSLGDGLFWGEIQMSRSQSRNSLHKFRQSRWLLMSAVSYFDFLLKKINIQQIFKWIPPETLNNQSFFSLRKKCLFQGKITTVWRWLCSFWLIGFDTAFECKRNHFSYQWKLEIKQSQVMFFFVRWHSHVTDRVLLNNEICHWNDPPPLP